MSSTAACFFVPEDWLGGRFAKAFCCSVVEVRKCNGLHSLCSWLHLYALPHPVALTQDCDKRRLAVTQLLVA